MFKEFFVVVVFLVLWLNLGLVSCKFDDVFVIYLLGGCFCFFVGILDFFIILDVSIIVLISFVVGFLIDKFCMSEFILWCLFDVVFGFFYYF